MRDDRREDDAEPEQAETPVPAEQEPRGGRPQEPLERAVKPPPETR